MFTGHYLSPTTAINRALEMRLVCLTKTDQMATCLHNTSRITLLGQSQLTVTVNKLITLHNLTVYTFVLTRFRLVTLLSLTIVHESNTSDRVDYTLKHYGTWGNIPSLPARAQGVI